MDYLTLRVITWTVGKSDPPEDLTSLLGLNEQELPGLYAIGLQDVMPVPMAVIAEGDLRDNWTAALTNSLSPRGYFLVKGIRLAGILLLVFMKRLYLMALNRIESKFNTSSQENKRGGVAINLNFRGITLCFINSHLSASFENLDYKIENLCDLLMEPRLPMETSIFDTVNQNYAFLIGNLNFRLRSMLYDQAVERIQQQNLEELLSDDELNEAKRTGIIQNFEEGAIFFPPTYKFDVGTDLYDTSPENKTPAWCDRILWHVHTIPGLELNVTQHDYTSLDQYRISCHRPVISTFTIIMGESINHSFHVVKFETVERWHAKDETDLLFFYRLPKFFLSSSRDYIGLYPVNFRSLEDTRLQTWARVGTTGEDAHLLYCASRFKRSIIKELPSGRYMLCYFSDLRNVVIGHSNEIEIAH